MALLDSPSPSQAESATARTERVELLLPSIRCAGCIAGVEKALAGQPGILKARVNLTNKRLSAEIDPRLTDAGALVAVLEGKGYAARPLDDTLPDPTATDTTGRDLLLRMGVAGFAAMNVMLLSVSVWSGAGEATRDLFHWISGLIALPAMVYAGLPFFRSAYGALTAGRLNMDVPITLAIALSAFSSLLSTAQHQQHAYFDAGIVLIFFLLIGRYLDHRTRARARSAAAELDSLTARSALQILPDGRRVPIATASLEPGMLVEIAAGERVPADGVVERGSSDLDRSLVTGESRPEPVEPGAQLHAGMLNLTGALQMRVSAAGRHTLLAEIARLVDAAERGRGRYDRLADRAARIYAPAVHVLAALGFAGWFLATGDWQVALSVATAVLIITCPCALALAVPTVHAAATGRLFRTGIFLKDGAELERLAEVDLIAFDKTGTLTEGTPQLATAPRADDPAWPLAAALAGASRHPLSRAIAARAEALGIRPAPLDDLREVPGFGVEARMGAHRLRLGRPGWAGETDDPADVVLDTGDGRTCAFRFSEQLRADAAETCAALRGMGLDLALLSGDGADAVARIAQATGIANCDHGLHPGDKLAILQRWRDDGRRVLMVGDGLNDGPALAAAHASMSPASAADVSRAAAGLVYSGERLGAVLRALRVARSARARALESFGLALIYNLVAIPVAFTGAVTPLIAALAMSGSSIVVVLNALRVRRAG
ncbi:MAG: cadmium-translocating P-type ATPase [Alphaproteobacteria bacterium]|nr:MAG: cadmium-translocating P-type ATPase [Alphaproteobacteria bacterium]